MKKLMLFAALLLGSIGTVQADTWTWTYTGIDAIGGIGQSNYGFGDYDSENDWWPCDWSRMTGKDANGETDEVAWTMGVNNGTQDKKPSKGASSGNWGLYVYGKAGVSDVQRMVMTTTAFKKGYGKVASVEVKLSKRFCAATLEVKVDGTSYGLIDMTETPDDTDHTATTMTLTNHSFTAPETGAVEGKTIEIIATTKEGTIGTEKSPYYGLCGITINFVEESDDTNTYGLVGDLTGGWDDDLDMLLSGGKYHASVDGFNATALSYEYKLRANHNWDGYQLPTEGNYTWTPADGIGIYNLSFTADIANNELLLTATKSASYMMFAVGGKMKIDPMEESENAMFDGYWNGETTTDLMPLGSDGLCRLSWKDITLDAQVVELKVIAKKAISDTEVLAWYGDSEGSNLYFSVPRAGNYDVEITFDPKTLEVTATCEEHKNAYGVTYVNVNDWTDVYAYTFGPELNGAWPGQKMEATGEQKNGHDVYTLTFKAEYVPNFIVFNNGGTGDGNQTADLGFVNGKLYYDATADPSYFNYDYDLSEVGGCMFRSSEGIFTSALGEIEWTISDLTWPAQTMTNEEGETPAAWLDVTNTGIYASSAYLAMGKVSDLFCLRTAKLTSQPLSKAVKQVVLKATSYGTASSPAAISVSCFVGDQQVGETVALNSTNGREENAQTLAFVPAEPLQGAVCFSFDQPETCRYAMIYEIHINFEGSETTGVSQIVNSKSSNSQYFDLQGRRVSQPTRGLYIVDGRKVVK